MAQAISVASRGWEFEVERGPDWLFVRPRRCDSSSGEETSFSEQVWALLAQHFAHRLVLELDALEPLDDELVAQLVDLEKRIHLEDGMMRICGLSGEAASRWRQRGPDAHFPCFRDRAEAVMAYGRPNLPR